MFYSVGIFRISSLGDSNSSNPKRNTPKRSWGARLHRSFTVKGKVVWTSKDYCKWKKTRCLKSRNFVLFYMWEDAIIPQLTEISPQLSGPMSCVFTSCVSSGLTTESGRSLMTVDGRYSFLPEFPPGSPAHHPCGLQLLVTMTSIVYWYSRKYSISQRCLKFKKKIELLYDPEIPLLVNYPKELRAESWRDICTPKFIAALFSIAIRWKQPKRPLANKRINKMHFIHIY